MDSQLRSVESIDDFVLRTRTLAQTRDFEDAEMDERLLAIVIGSTPIEDFHRDLLGRSKGYKVDKTIDDAIIAGRPAADQWRIKSR